MATDLFLTVINPLGQWGSSRKTPWGTLGHLPRPATPLPRATCPTIAEIFTSIDGAVIFEGYDRAFLLRGTPLLLPHDCPAINRLYKLPKFILERWLYVQRLNT